MLIFGIIIVILTGFLAVNLISPRFSWCEKTGLAFPVGMGLQTMAMAVIDLLGIRLDAASMLGAGVFLILAFSVPLYLKKEEIKAAYKDAFQAGFSGYNLVWLFFVALIVYLEYMNFAKCLYFPTFDRDSLAGFDTIGYVIAQEHTFKGLSLFQSDYMPGIHGPGSYIVYAPMVQLSYAFVYALGAETSKLVPALMFLFFLLAFYGGMKRVISRTGAAMATLLMMVTPEMVAFSSLSATNVIHAVSASLGVIYVSLWFKSKERKDLYAGSLLLGVNIWTRTDGVVFLLAALFVVSIEAVRTKNWKICVPVAASFLPALLWMAFAKISGFYAESIAITYPYWDGGKAGTIGAFMKSHYTNTLYYGWTFTALAVSFVLNGWYIVKKKDNLVLLTLIVVSSVLYMIALYQIDYKWDTIQNVLAYSAKRFLFCFVPMAWFYSLSNQWAKFALNKMDLFLAFKR